MSRTKTTNRRGFLGVASRSGNYLARKNGSPFDIHNFVVKNANEPEVVEPITSSEPQIPRNFGSGINKKYGRIYDSVKRPIINTFNPIINTFAKLLKRLIDLVVSFVKPTIKFLQPYSKSVMQVLNYIDAKYLMPVIRPVANMAREATMPYLRAIARLTRPLFGRLKRPIQKIVFSADRMLGVLRSERLKWARYAVYAVLLITAVCGTVIHVHQMVADSYKLSGDSEALIGSPDRNLLKNFNYDSKTNSYYLNKSSIKTGTAASVGMPSMSNSAQIGDGPKPSYSLKLPTNPHKGLTTYDNASYLSFSMTPKFSMSSGKVEDGHLVYPLGLGSGAKAVYTVKADGLQEDIIYANAPKGTVKLTYQLNLPSTLQAREMSNGSVGIYSADPSLFGNISYGTPKDQALVAKARLKSKKDNLVFIIPAPVINSNDGWLPNTRTRDAKLSLKGDTLTLIASGLGGIHGPVSIDPSVIIATVASWDNGNLESDVSYDSSNNQIKESSLSGGSIATWATNSTTFTTARAYFGSVAYGGYLYVMGGSSGSAVTGNFNQSTASSTPYLFTVPAGVDEIWVSMAGGKGGNGSAAGGSGGYTSFNLPVTPGATYNVYVGGAGNPASGATGGAQVAGYGTGGAGSNGSSSGYAAGSGGGSSAFVTTGGTVIAVDGGGGGGTVGDAGGYGAAGNNNGANGSSIGTAYGYGGTTSGVGAGATGCNPGSGHNGGAGCSGTYSSTTYGGGGGGGGYYGGGGGVGATSTCCNLYGSGGGGSGYFSSATAQGVTQCSGCNAGAGYVNITYNTAYYTYTGGTQTFTTPNSVTAITATMYGGAGGTNGEGEAGGAGGTSSGGSITVTPNTNYTVYVGGLGSPGSTTETGGAGAFGYGYGGAGATSGYSSSDGAGGGGGGSAIVTTGGSPTALEVAGGGGGAGTYFTTGLANTPGTGGGATGGTGTATGGSGGNGGSGSSGGLAETGGGCTSTSNGGNNTSTGGAGGVGCQGSAIYGAGGGGGGGYGGGGGGAGENTAATAYYGGGGGGSGLAASGGTTTSGGSSGYGTVTITFGTSSPDNDVQYALLCTGNNSTGGCSSGSTNAGKLGTWNYTYNGNSCSTSASPCNGGFNNARYGLSTVAYNGYLYILGGYDNTTYYSDVQDALICTGSNNGVGGCGATAGAVGTWVDSASSGSPTTAGSFSTGTYLMGAAAYNGYLYIAGGYTSGGVTNNVYYAKITAAGTLSANTNSCGVSWCSTSSFTAARSGLGVATYNGYLYITGGSGTASSGDCNSGGLCNGVQYAPINANGSLGSFVTSSNTFTNARYGLGVAAYNGYLYISAGTNGSTSYGDVQYATINANGSISPFATSSSITPNRFGVETVAYNGYLYDLGGTSPTSGGGCTTSSGAVYYCSDSLYVSINSAAVVGANWTDYTSTTNGAIYNARAYFGSVAYNGYLYIIGGQSVNGSQSFSYTGGTQTFTTGNGVYAISATMYGGNGGANGEGEAGGAGGTSSGGSITVTPNTNYTVYVGGLGSPGSTTETGGAGAFGYGYGGAGATSGYSSSDGAGGGGGGSAIVTTGGSPTALEVAGGGGGAGTYFTTGLANTPGTGGGATGGTGTATGGSGGNGGSGSSGGLAETGGGCTSTSNGGNNTSTGGAGGVGCQGSAIYGAGGGGGGGYGGGGGGAGENTAATAYYGGGGGGSGLAASGGSTTAGGNNCAAGGYGCVTINWGNFPQQDTLFAAISSNGSLAAPSSCSTFASGSSIWCEGTALSTYRWGLNAVAHNGYLYVLGGYNSVSTTYYNDIEYALICTGSNSGTGGCGSVPGSIGTWNDSTSTTGNFATAREVFGTALYGSYLYIVGGYSGSNQSDVQFTQLSATGAPVTPNYCSGASVGTAVGDVSLTGGTWCETYGITNARYGAGVVAYNGYLYMLGGFNGTTYYSDVQRNAINPNGSLISSTWTDNTTTGTGAFTTGRYYFGTVASNGYLYIMGGYSGSNQQDLQYAAINPSNGSLTAPTTCTGGLATSGGDWCLGTSLLTSGRNGIGAVVNNGFLYVIGGTNSGAYYSDVQVDNINNGGQGTVSSWTDLTSTGAFTGARTWAGTAAYNGYLYLIGGYGAASTNDCNSTLACNGVQYAPISAGGSVGTWHYTYNGSSGTYMGTTGTGGGLASALYGLNAQVYDGYIYALGGYDGTNLHNDIEYALLCTGNNNMVGGCGTTAGAVGTWTDSTSSSNGSFTTPVVYLTAAQYNGNLYIMGGCTNSACTSVTNAVQYVPLNSNGSITTAWNNATGFTTARAYLSGLAYDGYLYIIGGRATASDGIQCLSTGTTYDCGDVQYAAINSNGSLSSNTCGTSTTWCYTTGVINGEILLQSAVAYDGFMYIYGGDFDPGAVIQSAVEYAPINNNGGLGNWSLTTAMTARYGDEGVVYNGYVYAVGGYSAGYTGQTDVQYAGLQSISRVGNYTRLIDFTGTNTVSGVTGINADDPTPDEILETGGDCTPTSGTCSTDTTNPGLGATSSQSGPGGIFTNYEFASNACPYLNSSQSLATGSSLLSTPYPLVYTTTSSQSITGCSSTSTSNGRYMWLQYLLDDSQTASFPDQSGNHSAVSSVNIYFRPDAGYRLRDGESFGNGSLQNLDTPP